MKHVRYTGPERGGGKRFVLECAATYISIWGLYKNEKGEEEDESAFKDIRAPARAAVVL